MRKSVRLEDSLSECLHEDILGFPGGSDGKEPACSVGYLVSTPGSGRSPGEDNGSPLQYSCLENLVDRGACGLQRMGRKESDTTERLTFCYFLAGIVG